MSGKKPSIATFEQPVKIQFIPTYSSHRFLIVLEYEDGSVSAPIEATRLEDGLALASPRNLAGVTGGGFGHPKLSPFHVITDELKQAHEATFKKNIEVQAFRGLLTDLFKQQAKLNEGDSACR